MEKSLEAIYSIRQVIDLTGVSEFTLRAWENRYSAFSPTRTSSGRRRYNSDDIAKARLLLKLTEKGYRIGNIANLPTATLQQLSEERDLVTQREVNSQADDIAKLILHADQFNWESARQLMIQKRESLPARSYIFDFILPLLSEVSYQISLGQLTIAQEHILSAFVKEELLYLKAKKTSKNKSHMRIVLATPEGDMHEIGLLIAHVLTHLAGITTLYLGPNVPPRELCECSERFDATHLLLVATVDREEGTKYGVLQYIHFLDQNLPASTQLWLAGRKARGPEMNLQHGYQIIDHFHDFESLINKELK